MGIKDAAYASLFDKKDLSSLYRLAEKVRATHDQTLVDNFNLQCQKKVDDHNPILEIGNQRIEFLQVSKADDLVVNAGVDLCIDQILGTSVVRWRYMYTTNGSATPAVTDTVVGGSGTGIVDMSLFGWREYASSSLRFAGIFGESLISNTISEAGVMTNGTYTGTLLNKNIFSSFPIVHAVNVTGWVISTIIEFVPMM